jgi:hypothetical protein
MVLLIQEYEFLVPIEGLTLRDQKRLELGSIRIQPSDRTLFDQVKLGGLLDPDVVTFIERGCRTLAQIRVQSARLDSQMSRPAPPAAKA